MKKFLLVVLLVYSQSFFAQCLKGNYSIPSDFPTINAAVNALVANGVCEPVVFTIQPGVYPEHIAIPSINGTSAVNTITFKSSSTDNTAVRIEFTGNDTVPDVIRFNGADYVTFQGMHIKNKVTGVYMCGILFFENSDYNKISNCVLENGTSTNTNGYQSVLVSNGVFKAHLTIENNRFYGGTNGITLTGDPQFPSAVVIQGNTFQNQFSKGIEVIAVKDVSVTNNIFNYADNASYLTAVSLFNQIDSATVSGNEIYLGTESYCGVLIDHMKNTLVSNNKIISKTGRGISVSNSDHVNVYHNTVVGSSVAENYSECIEANDNTYLSIKNNILYQKGKGRSLFVYGNNTNYESDYNNLYSSDINNSFKEWKKTTGQNLHSLNYLPSFVSGTDLHIASNFSQNIVLPYFSEVATDIEGHLRDVASPYFGAYEFENDVNLPDASVDEIITPVQNCVGATPIQFMLKNFSAVSLTAVTINWSVNNIAQPPLNWTGNLNGMSRALVNLGTINYAETGTYLIKIGVSSPNNNTDTFTANDTLSIRSYSKFKGTYTIGGTNPTFDNLGAASIALKNGGVCGSVTLKIRPGTYTESATFSGVSGLEGANSLTITSEDGIASSVRIKGAANNYTLQLRNIKNVFIKNITFHEDVQFTRNVYITDSVENVELSGCVLERVMAFQADGIIRNIRILNNTFDNAATIEFAAMYQTRLKSIQIKDNIFKRESGTWGVKLVGIDSLVYSNNKVASLTSYAPSVVLDEASYVTIDRNDFSYYNNVSAMAVGYGVNNTSITNNMFSGRFTGYTTTVSIRGENIAFVNNSIYCSSLYVAPLAVEFTPRYLGCKFWNNIIVNKGGGLLMECGSGVENIDFKNNAYFYTGTKFAYGINTFADWQQVSKDNSSFIVDPDFKSVQDLHVNEITLKNAGYNASAITTVDHDNDPRDQTPDIGADEFIPTVVDASTRGFAANLVSCYGSQPIQLMVRNSGTSVLTSVDLPYTVNLESFQYHWTGTLQPGNEVLVNLGNYDFKSHTSYKLKAWSTNPNNSTDIITINDTSSTTFYTGLKGIYTIGGSAPDFVYPGEAVDAMLKGGLCGPVVFNLRNGDYSYYTKLSIPYIKGNSAANTITFQSESHDSSLVTLLCTSQFSGYTVIDVDSAAYISFSKLTFKVETEYDTEFFKFARTRNCVIKNCQFIAPFYEYSRTSFISAVSTVDSLSILNNKFIRGKIAITAAGSHVNIAHNYFESQNVNGIVGSGPGIFYSANEFNYTKKYTGKAILLSGNAAGMVAKNRFVLTGENFKAISLEGTRQASIVVANNFIGIAGGTGIYVNDTYITSILHNTIVQKGKGICIGINATSSTVAKNNIYYNSSPDTYCVSLTNNTNYASDHNCIFSTSENLVSQDGINYSLLKTYTTASARDSNSISIDPKFFSDRDLHVSDATVGKGGVFTSMVTDDIDNEIRNPLHPSIGADEFPEHTVDAALISFKGFSSRCIAGNNAVGIVFKNNGSNPLTSAAIHWEINGIAQPVYNWTGTLNSEDTLVIPLGHHDLQMATLYAIKAWISNPNGSTDQLQLNDTVTLSLKVPIPGGVYTIGGTNPTFPDLLKTAEALNTHGICGAVTFKIRNGVYEGQLSFNACEGASLLNNVVFESEGLDSSAVEIRTDKSIESREFLLTLNGADYFTFRKLTFRNSLRTFSPCILIKGDASYNEIKNCQIISEAPSSGAIGNIIAGQLSFTNESVIEGNNYNVIENNLFLNGNCGISMAVSPDIKNVIKNNTLIVNDAGIQLSAQKGLKIINNKITANADGITVLSLLDSLTISGNIIKTKNALTALSITNPFDFNKPSFAYVNVYNNYIQNEKDDFGAAVVKFESYQNTSVNFINNTVRVEEAACAGMRIVNGRGEFNCFNNIISIKSNIALSYSNYPGTVFKSKANNFYNTSGMLMHDGTKEYATLAEYQLATSQDSLSLNIKPNFVTSSSYQLNNTLLNNKGISFNAPKTDIENKLRNTTNPDMGCYEFDAVGNDAGITAINSASFSCSGTSDVIVTLQNFGSNTLTNAVIGWTVNGHPQANYSYTGTIASNQSVANVTVGTFTSSGQDVIAVFPVSVNGSTDVNTFNDTVKNNHLAGSLNGTYTVGLNNADFKSLADVKDKLVANGICGPVIFQLLPGVYKDPIVFPGIVGASSTNTITFEPYANSQNLVTLSFYIDSNSDFFLRTESAAYYRFRHLNFVTWPDVFNSNGNSFLLGLVNSKNIDIDSCHFTKDQYFTNVNANVYGAISASNSDSIKVTNNEIASIGRALDFRRDGSATSGTSLLIANNQIVNAKEPLFIDKFDNAILKNNLFQRIQEPFYSGYTAATISNCSGITAERNKFIGMHSGLTISEVNAAGNTKSRFINNFILGHSYISKSNDLEFVSNNMVCGINDGVTANSTDLITLELYLNNRLTFINNNIANFNGKPAISLLENQCLEKSDNNNYYCPNSLYILTKNFPISNVIPFEFTLPDLQQLLHLEEHSVSVNPQFITNTDIHSSNPLLQGLGQAGTGVTTDIDGMLRAINPTIGANEVFAPVGSVWPGDANNDHAANNVDLLTIGLLYGEKGPARAMISNQWQAHLSNDWGKLQDNGSDMKHADCNGDGIIDSGDTLAIHLNFSSTHAFADVPQQKLLSAANLQFKTDKLTYAAGEWVTVDILAGTPQLPVEKLYGIAFNVQYTSVLAEPGTEKLEYTDSWLSKSNSNVLAFSRVDRAASTIFAAQTGIDHTNRTGFGKIATLHFQVSKSVAANATMNFAISGYVANEANGDSLHFDGIPYQVMVSPVITAIPENEAFNAFTVYPNPYSSAATIFYSLKEKSKVQLEVYNIVGELIQTIANDVHAAGDYKYAFSAKENGFNPGVYFVKLTIDGKATIIKIIEL